MRESLRGLTTRGRVFLGSGVVCFLGGLLLGEATVVKVSAFAMVLPLFAAAFVGRNRYRLALVRSVSPQLVTAGQPALVTLGLTNEGKAPSGVLLLEEQLPYVLGTRPRFALGGVHQGWHRQVNYQVRSEVRGRYDIGPMTVRLTDPFGLIELGRAFRATVPLIVTPRTVALPAIPLGGSATGSGDNRPRAFAVGSAEDVTVREYRRGDDLRRVHWRSSARVGDLMVRREEQPWQSRATVFLDTRAHVHRGQGLASSFEGAVSSAASIALHLSQRGFMVRLVTATGEQEATAWHMRDASTNSRPLMESLAVVTLVSRDSIDCSWLTEGGHSGVTVGVFGAVASPDAAALRRMAHNASAAIAILVDAYGWQHPERDDPERCAPQLHLASGQGWRCGVLGPTDRLESVWQDLGRRSQRPGLNSGIPGSAHTTATLRDGAVW